MDNCSIIVILIFMFKEDKIQLLQYMQTKCLQDNLLCENFVVLRKKSIATSFEKKEVK